MSKYRYAVEIRGHSCTRTDDLITALRIAIDLGGVVLEVQQ